MSAKCHVSARCGVLLATFLFSVALRPQPSRAQAPNGEPAEQAVGPEEVVLTVGDNKITAAEFEKILSALPPQFQSSMAQMGKQGFANQYGNLLGLTIEGQKRKVDQKEEFQRMLAFERLVLLAQVTLNELIATLSRVNSEEIAAYYKANEKNFEQAKVRGIYIPFESGETAGADGPQPQGQSEEKSGAALTEDQAKAKAEALRTRIVAGENIASLAKTESVHPTSEQGGDFGYIGRNQVAPQIEEMIFSIPLNQVSSPVRDRFGFFLLLVESKRAQPMEEATPLIENNLRQQKLTGTLTKLQEEYPVTLNPKYFNEPSAPGMDMPPQRGPEKP